MKKTGFLTLFTALALAITLVAAERPAAALRCSVWSPQGVCTAYRPDHPLNGRDCSSSPYADQTPPGPNEVNIYSQPDRGGWCVTLPANMGLWNLDSSNGWYGPFYVKDIWVGSTMDGGEVCYQQWGRTCVGLWPGYNYSYAPPTYPYSYTPGWQSIQVLNCCVP
jgi:hypothetical protein